jgi:tetratricopeptide (TPR) repeat protein
LATSEKHEPLPKEEKVAADSKAKLLGDAERFVLHGKMLQAISAYQKIVSIDPNDVLILNTIGDLYLKLNAVAEANTYFSKVAENYVRNNYFLKALAVYKKILQPDPNNIEINSIMASLFAKQGLSIDARNQYLRVAALLEQEGKTKELLNIYVAIVELDPSNSDFQQKLAALYQAEGAEAKAQTHWMSAARAQVQAGELNGAMNSFERAIQLSPLDEKALSGLLDCCLKIGNLNPALEQLKKSREMAPLNLNIRDMLGRAYMESGDSKAAAEVFQAIGSIEEVAVETKGLLGVFCPNDQQSTAREVAEPQPLPQAIQEVPDVLHGAPQKSLQEQLQEVDFYIQLGFNDEALEKLNEIAKANPNHPEWASRYETLGNEKKAAPQSIPSVDSAQPLFTQSSEDNTVEGLGNFQLLEFDNIPDRDLDEHIEKLQDGTALESLWNSAPSAIEPSFQHAELSQDAEPSKPAGTHVLMNDMFTDLMEEVSAIDRDEAKAAFEEHFSLGTAYREMDLIEEAIKEFETALKAVDMQKGDPRVIQCCGMLSTCFLMKNMPHSALRWCQTGLRFIDISSHEAMALRYDMGVAHSMAGRQDEALDCFNQVFCADPSYRDVAQRMDALRSGIERHAS